MFMISLNAVCSGARATALVDSAIEPEIFDAQKELFPE